jgi:hypothetical protein
VYGDVEVMRHRAGELREQAVELRLLADRLIGSAEAVAWRGRAADALRERIRDRAAHLRDLAVGHESAATALDRHRDEVERLSDAIAAAERRAGAHPPASGDGRGLPPPGHRDWLTRVGNPPEDLP